MGVLTDDHVCCDSCSEEGEFPKCDACDKIVCSDCQELEEHKLKRCDICNARFCPDCGIEFPWDGGRVCAVCIDNRMYITFNNYTSLTNELNEAIEWIAKIEDPDRYAAVTIYLSYANALGQLQGTLKTLKNRFGF